MCWINLQTFKNGDIFPSTIDYIAGLIKTTPTTAQPSSLMTKKLRALPTLHAGPSCVGDPLGRVI